MLTHHSTPKATCMAVLDTTHCIVTDAFLWKLRGRDCMIVNKSKNSILIPNYVMGH